MEESSSQTVSIDVGAFPEFATYDPKNGYVYVPGENSNIVTAIDGTSIVANVTVGQYPRAAVYDAANGDVYVPDSIEDAVSVISGTTVVGTVSIPTDPNFAAYDSSDGYVYVVSASSPYVSVISGSTLVTTINAQVSQIGSGGQAYIFYDPANGNVYIPNYNFPSDDNVSVIHGTTFLGTVNVGVGSQFATYDGANGYMYVENSGSGNLSVISGTTVAATVGVGGVPLSGAYDNATGDVYVGNANGNSVSVIDGSSVVGTVESGNNPQSATYDDGTAEIFVSNVESGTVTEIYGVSSVGTANVGTSPGFAAYDAANGFIYVPNVESNNVSVIEPSAVVTHTVTFSESGLPSGTSWSVTLGGVTQSSTVDAIKFKEVRGNYTFSLLNIGNYTAWLSTNEVSVLGSAITVDVTFAPTSPAVMDVFLPACVVGLSIDVNGVVNSPYSSYGGKLVWSWGDTTVSPSNFPAVHTYSKKGTYIFTASVQYPNGSVSSASGTAGVGPSANSGCVLGTVLGSTGGSISYIDWNLGTGTIASGKSQLFHECLGCGPSVTAIPAAHYGFINWTMIGGPPSFIGSSTSPSTYVVFWAEQTATVTFERVYPVKFSETGLPHLTVWRLTLTPLTGSPSSFASNSSLIEVNVTNGPYNFTMGSVQGFIASPEFGSFTVAGASISEKIDFSAATGVFGDPFSEPSLNASDWWADSPVLSSIAQVEDGFFPSSVALSEPSTTPEIGGGQATWQVAGVGSLYGVTSRDVFVPPFTANLEVAAQSPLYGAGTPATIFLSNGTATPLLAVFLGSPYLDIQIGTEVIQTDYSIQSANEYTVRLAVGVTSFSVLVTGGGSTYQDLLAIAQPADSAYYLSLGTFAGQAPGENSHASYSDGVTFGAVSVVSSQEWSLPVTVKAQYQQVESGTITTTTSLVQCAEVGLTDNFTGFSIEGATGGTSCGGSAGKVDFSGLYTGIYNLSAEVTETFQGGNVQTLGTLESFAIGNPEDPASSAAAGVTLLISIPPPPALQFSLSPSGPVSVDSGAAFSLTAEPFGSSGDYTSTGWWLDGSAISSSATTPCAPTTPTSSSGQLGFVLTCTFATSGHHHVNATATATGYWFNIAVDQTVNSPVVDVTVNPAVYCGDATPASSSSPMSIVFSSAPSPSCTVSGLDIAILHVDNGLVTFNASLSDSFAGSVAIPQLPIELQSILGVDYPFYDVELDSQSTGSIVELDSQTLTPVQMTLPAGTPTTPSGGLDGTQFTITLDPTTAHAILADAIISIFAAAGVWQVLQSDLPLGVAQVVEQTLLEGVSEEVAKEYSTQAEALLNADPLTLLSDASTFLGSLTWAVIETLLSGTQAWLIGDAIDNTLTQPELATLESGIANDLGQLIKWRAIADSAFDLTAIVVTILRGSYSQLFTLGDLTSGTGSIIQGPASFPSGVSRPAFSSGPPTPPPPPSKMGKPRPLGDVVTPSPLAAASSSSIRTTRGSWAGRDSRILT